MPAATSALTGSSGVYYVMHRLLRMDKIAALAPEGVPNVDLIVTNIEGEKVSAVQVKTRSGIGSNGGWQMKERHEHLIATNLYYCFVELEKDAAVSPSVWVIPSKIVALSLKETHALWKSIPGKKGQPHKDTDMRWLLPDFSKTFKKVDDPIVRKYSQGWLDQYREKWELIG
jgi:hypothetical protein